ncbi:MAG: hypothetical protein A3E81_01385 [Gammaproteobacteria bacterium RIFCSPHIGHO2_12_FULL_36_30]|nr:MAG: hypothetical protein A3E81_01385 [Gammaproteobacteria bacterium RIFCSPHIGHO2_12_FULL_36_30]
MKKQLDWFDDKRLLSLVRKGDYAHAGEIEAIDYVFSSISKNKHRQILDVGCGLGGTAEYIQQHDFGYVTGFDIDTNAIIYAKEKYPAVEFYTCDAINAEKLLPHKKYDLIYSFNSFFAFSDKLRVLQNLAVLAKPRAQLIIFDYIHRAQENKSAALKNNIMEMSFTPVNLDHLEKMMLETKWKIKKIENLDHEFQKWYCDFLSKITQHKENIVSEFNEEAYLKLLSTFTGIYNALNDKIIGGGVMYAELNIT